MTLQPWKELGKKLVAKNNWWSYWEHRFSLPDGRESDYHVIHTRPAVGIIAIDSDGKIVCVRQYRPAIGDFSLEVPMGVIEEHQTPREAAFAELSQEAQCHATRMEDVGSFYASCGLSDSRLTAFFAHGLSVSDGQPDENEEFEVFRYSVQEFEKLLAEGVITSGLTITCWALARPKVMAVIDQLASGR